MAAFLDKESMNQIDARSKLLVFGYFRNISEITKAVHGDVAYYNVPDLVVRLCLTYFYILREEFKNHYTEIVIGADRQSADNTIGGAWHSVFGRHRIESTEHSLCIWEFKLAVDSCYSIVGITSNPDKMDLPCV